MAQDPSSELLTTRAYSFQDQQTFAQLSGDYNPIHVDPVAARRILTGCLVVHGLHLALTGLEELLRHLGPQIKLGAVVAKWNAQFLKPVLVDDKVAFNLTTVSAQAYRILVTNRSERASLMTITLGESATSASASVPPLPDEPLSSPGFEELRGQSGSLDLGLDVALSERQFPLTTKILGPAVMMEMLALTRLVGMRVPGLNSLFNQFDVRWSPDPSSNALRYQVDDADERFGRLTLSVNGPLYQGKVVAFYRPPQQAQANMTEIAQRVSPGSYSASVALIVGGSRGLGEVTAKIIAAGGGFPLITYHSGATDAERVASEIRQAGGRCEILKLDVHDLTSFAQFLDGNVVPRSIYYFATPKIMPRRGGLFDFDLLQKFTGTYVTAFGQLLELAAAKSKERISVFYPSTVYVEEKPPELAEYYLAKQLGEEFCAYYSQHSKRIHIESARLPRVKTDQTTTLMPLPAEDSFETMLPLVHRMEGQLNYPSAAV